MIRNITSQEEKMGTQKGGRGREKGSGREKGKKKKLKRQDGVGGEGSGFVEVVAEKTRRGGVKKAFRNVR